MWQEMHWHDVGESHLQHYQTLRAEAERRSDRLNDAGGRHLGPLRAIRAWLASLQAARQATVRPALIQPCPQEN